MIIQPWPDNTQLSQYYPANTKQEYALPPRVIYHYTSFETALLIIAGQTLRFSHPDTFNDPLDLYHGLINFKGKAWQIRDWVNQNVELQNRKELLQPMLRDPRAAEEIAKGSVDKTKKALGICCFSKNHKQVLMWSHYAQKHKGVCLGFNIKPIQHLSSSEDFFMHSVNYPNQVVPMDYFPDTVKAVNHWVFTKAPCWAYEQEVRAVINGIPASPDIQFDKACLKEIYFGCRTTTAQRASLTKLLKANGFSLDTWQQMQIDDATFSVKAVPYEVSTS